MGVENQVPETVVSLTLRPQIPMSYFAALPFVCALAVRDALRQVGVQDVGLAWPYDVVAPQGLLAAIKTHAGYDDEGIFAVCDVYMQDADQLKSTVEEAICAQVGSWEKAVATGQAAGGPLAPLLSDLFDAQVQIGTQVELVRAGRAVGRVTFEGLDIWGRASVKLEDGKRLDIAPEQARLCPLE